MMSILIIQCCAPTWLKVDQNHLVLSHAQSVDLSGEIVCALRTRLQWLRQVALSCRQVGAHLWHRSPVVSRQQRDSNPGPLTLSCLRQALEPTELPPTPVLAKLEQSSIHIRSSQPDVHHITKDYPKAMSFIVVGNWAVSCKWFRSCWNVGGRETTLRVSSTKWYSNNFTPI